MAALLEVTDTLVSQKVPQLEKLMGSISFHHNISTDEQAEEKLRSTEAASYLFRKPMHPTFLLRVSFINSEESYFHFDFLTLAKPNQLKNNGGPLHVIDTWPNVLQSCLKYDCPYGRLQNVIPRRNPLSLQVLCRNIIYDHVIDYQSLDKLGIPQTMISNFMKEFYSLGLVGKNVIACDYGKTKFRVQGNYLSVLKSKILHNVTLDWTFNFPGRGYQQARNE